MEGGPPDLVDSFETDYPAENLRDGLLRGEPCLADAVGRAPRGRPGLDVKQIHLVGLYEEHDAAVHVLRAEDAAGPLVVSLAARGPLL